MKRKLLTSLALLATLSATALHAETKLKHPWVDRDYVFNNDPFKSILVIGVPNRPENRRALAARGYVIYLYATVDEQVRRTRRDRRRPLLQQGDPEQVLRDLMAVRDPLYREIADHIIETDGCSPRTVAQRLVRELQAHA